jgi:hypothetical protein
MNPKGKPLRISQRLGLLRLNIGAEHASTGANCQKRFFGEDRHMQRMTITALARAEGVDKALMSRRVKQLKLETLPGAHGAKLVTVASYLRALGRPADEELQPPGDQLDRLVRRGNFGVGAQADIRLKAARRYQVLSSRAGGGDLKAAAQIGDIHRALGVDGTERCRALLIEGRPMRCFFEADRRYVLRSFREHLDCIAENFSRHDSASAAASAARELTGVWDSTKVF